MRLPMTPSQLRERRQSFDRLYRRHRAEIFRAALRATGDRDEAEEVTQSAFLDAYRAWDAGTSPREPRAWLFAIAENTRRRRYWSRLARPQAVALDEVADERTTADAPTAREIQAALADLPEHQRAALVLREIGGWSYGEIAADLDLSVASVQMLLFRARRTLRSRLAPSGPTIVLPGWLTGWTSWLGSGGAPAAKIVAGAGAVAVGLALTVGEPPPASSARPVAPLARPDVVTPPHVAVKLRRATPQRAKTVAVAAPALDRRQHAMRRPKPSRPTRPAPTAAAPTPTPAPSDRGPPRAPGADDAAPLPSPLPPPTGTTTVSTPPLATPTITTPSVEISAQLPAGPALDLELPAVEVPSVEVPSVEVPQLPAPELPPAELPPVDLPGVPD
jgi:RNA polymerase sigma-70 factor (ECF subfamily)